MPTIRGIGNWIITNKPDKWGKWTASVDVGEDFITLLKEGQVKSQIQDINHDKETEVHHPDAKFKFTFKRPAKRKDGSDNTPVVVVDSQKNPMPGVMVGNGSEVVVQYSVYDYNDSGTPRKAFILEKVQVLKLVPYEAPDEFKEESGGFVVDNTGVI